MSKQVKVYLLDILQAIDEIEGFTRDLTFEQFSENKMAIRAVTMDFAVIGEATKQIPTEVRNKHAEVPWRQMAGIRDRIIHGYAYIKLSVLWDAVKLDLPLIKPLIKRIVESEYKE